MEIVNFKDDFYLFFNYSDNNSENEQIENAFNYFFRLVFCHQLFIL